MGMSEITTWISIRRYDKLESENGKLQTIVRQLSVTQGQSIEELKSTIFRLIDLEDDQTRVLKIRREDNHLIPISSLLNGSSSENPFIVDVVGVHQFCPVETRPVLPSYIDALKSEFANLEKRVKIAETTLPNLTNNQIQAVEDTTLQLANCVSFLDRRLDELIPSTWKPQILSNVKLNDHI